MYFFFEIFALRFDAEIPHSPNERVRIKKNKKYLFLYTPRVDLYIVELFYIMDYVSLYLGFFLLSTIDLLVELQMNHEQKLELFHQKVMKWLH